MAKVIKAELLKIEKEYSFPRKTVIEDAQAAVFVEKEIPEQEIMFIMDRFGYAKTIDMAAYDRYIAGDIQNYSPSEQELEHNLEEVKPLNQGL